MNMEWSHVLDLLHQGRLTVYPLGVLSVIVFAIALIINEPSVTLFVIGLVYCVSGPVEWLWRRHTGRALELSEPPPPQPNEG